MLTWEVKEGKICGSFKPVLSEPLSFTIENILGSDYKAKDFYTLTTDIRDFIGNIKSIDGDKCTVFGLYRGKERLIKNIRIVQPVKVGDRIIVTEYINLDGKFQLIATKSRILMQKNPWLTFINVGWLNTNNNGFYYRIDPYFGGFKTINA